MSINIANYDSDKESFIEHYEKIFKDFKDQSFKMLELGIFRGGSMLYWRDFFPKAEIIGVDLNIPDISSHSGERIHMYQCDQTDFAKLEEIAQTHAKDKFKIIIDDASHFGKETFESFVYLFKNHLQSGGVYVIEDWGTGYWPHFPDGRNLKMSPHHVSYHLHNETDSRFVANGVWEKGIVGSKKRFRSHDFGMVGVVKQIIDEVAISAVTHKKYTANPLDLSSMVHHVEIYEGQCFVFKK